MKCTVLQSNFRSSNGTDSVNFYIYMQENIKPKGILQIAHGMCEYFLRYDDFAKFLASKGYIVCGNDHIGHGNSVKNDDDLGYFAEKNGYAFLVEDVHRMTTLIKAKYPSIPIVLMGHSMGSFISRLYLDCYSQDIDGVILSGTSGGNPAVKFGKATIEAMKKIYGDRHRSEFVKALASFGHKYENSYSRDYDWLTRDTKVIDEYKKDKKCTFVFTLSGYLDLFNLLEKISDKDWGANIRHDLPIYIFSGDSDPVGDFGKGVTKVHKHLLAHGIQNVKIKLYEKGRHEMLNETNHQEVYSDILNWLEEICTNTDI